MDRYSSGTTYRASEPDFSRLVKEASSSSARFAEITITSRRNTAGGWWPCQRHQVDYLVMNSEPRRVDVAPWKWAIIRSDLSANTRHFLLTLAVRMDDDGTVPSDYPVGTRQLARDVGRRRHTVIASIQEATETGFLIALSRHGQMTIYKASVPTEVVTPLSPADPTEVVSRTTEVVSQIDGSGYPLVTEPPLPPLPPPAKWTKSDFESHEPRIWSEARKLTPEGKHSGYTVGIARRLLAAKGEKDEQTARNQRLQDEIDACQNCDRHGLVIDGDQLPIEPTRHCKHEAVPIAS